MQIDKKEKFTLITSNENSFTEFYNSFLKEENKFLTENIVLVISNNINVTNKDFLLFLDKAVQKKENGTSFVIVNTEIDVDAFPDNFNIVPTLLEAEDVIDMENMERELGF